MTSILKRSEQSRARISAKTVRILARRTNLRSAFVVALISELADRHDWVMSELASGGYGAVQAKSLEAAKAVTAKKWLDDAERKTIRRPGADLSAFETEVGVDQNEPDDDD